MKKSLTRTAVINMVFRCTYRVLERLAPQALAELEALHEHHVIETTEANLKVFVVAAARLVDEATKPLQATQVKEAK